MSSQSLFGLILILVGAIISLIGIFVISFVNNFLTAVIVTSIGFFIIAVGGGIVKARIGKWVNR